MQDKNFEHQVKDLLYNHKEAAPDVMSNVFQKRTPLYVFRNKLILNKYKLIAAAALIGVLAFLVSYNTDNAETVEPINNSTTNKQNPAIVKAEDHAAGIQPAENPIVTENITDDDQALDKDNSVRSTAQGQQATIKKVSDKPIHVNNSELDNIKNAMADLKNRKKARVDVEGDAKGTGDSGDASQGALTNQSQNSGTKVTEVADKSVAQQDKNQRVNQDEVAPGETDANNTDDAKDLAAKTDQVKSTDDKTDADNFGDDNDFELPKTKRGNWSVSLHTLAGLGNRNLDQSGDLATVVVRDNTESNKFSYGSELLLNYRISDNLEAYSGFGFFNRREAMTYKYQTQETIQDISSKQVIEHHPVFGTRTITVHDTTYTTKDIETSGDYNNTYNHYYVPLGLRYTLYHKTIGVHFAVNSGLEIATKTNGVILDDKYQEFDLSNGFARASLGKMVGVGVGATILVRERLNILAEIKGNFFISPTNGESYPITQQDMGYGLSLGVKYDLN